MASHPLLREVIEWDTVNWGRALAFWEEFVHVTWAGARVLELGSRHGGLSLWAASKGASVVCSDKNGPSPRAREEHRRHGVAERVEYCRLDALSIGSAADYDLILFKSMLGAVGCNDRPELQRQAIAEMHRALKPGGQLLFAENLVGPALYRFLRRHFVAWGKQWRYVTKAEMLGFVADFAEVRCTTLGFLGVLGLAEWQRRLLGKLDMLGADRLVPSSWHCIIAGVATKAR